MIPEEKKAGVVHARRETSGVTAFEDVCGMTKDLRSDLVFRVVVHKSSFLLRITMRIEGEVRGRAPLDCAELDCAELLACVGGPLVPIGVRR